MTNPNIRGAFIKAYNLESQEDKSHFVKPSSSASLPKTPWPKSDEPEFLDWAQLGRLFKAQFKESQKHTPTEVRIAWQSIVQAISTPKTPSLRRKKYYEMRNNPKFFKVGDMVNLQLHRGYKIPDVQNKKVEQLSNRDVV